MKIGDKVLCLDGTESDHQLRTNASYTVHDIIQNWGDPANPWLALYEVKHKETGTHLLFLARRFKVMEKVI